MSKVWFARLMPVGHPRKTMSPVSREGWLVVTGFIVAMGTGALLFFWLLSSGRTVLGVALYALIALAAGGGYLWAASARSDQQRSVDDYRRMASRERT